MPIFRILDIKMINIIQILIYIPSGNVKNSISLISAILTINHDFDFLIFVYGNLNKKSSFCLFFTQADSSLKKIVYLTNLRIAGMCFFKIILTTI